MRTVLQGGTVVDADRTERADVVVEGDVVRVVGEARPAPEDHVVDCTGRLVMPGFVDAHSHVDGLLGDDDVQRALLRQGVTSVVLGQDGVSYAPGDGRYASEYFAAIDGRYDGDSGSVGSFIASTTAASRVNAAYLVPAGTLRDRACGRSSDPATPEQLAAMTEDVAAGLRDGAVGLSTGLDYVPGIFADADEIAALCAPVAAADGVYVTHMRGGYEANSAAGVDEIVAIARASGVRVHISHFHATAETIEAQMAALAAAGVDVTFDAYPYTRGCTLLSMPLLPPALVAQDVDDVVRTITDPAARERLRREWFPHVAEHASLGPDWGTMITLAHVPAPEYAWAHGLTLDAAAERAGVDRVELVLDVLAATRLETNVVMAVRQDRSDDELARIFAHPAHMGGSDGIFVGAHPHPRARGTFGRYLRRFVRESDAWSWTDAVRHLSAAPAARFRLGDRGRVRPGAVADLVVVDPARVADRATYERPLEETVGIDDVLVAGRVVLAGGELVDDRVGAPLVRAASTRDAATPDAATPDVGPGA